MYKIIDNFEMAFKNKSTTFKLNITDNLPYKEGKDYPLRIREDLNTWIMDNTHGSKNSVINFLINVGINQLEGILEHDSIYETIMNSELEKK